MVACQNGAILIEHLLKYNIHSSMEASTSKNINNVIVKVEVTKGILVVVNPLSESRFSYDIPHLYKKYDGPEKVRVALLSWLTHLDSETDSDSDSDSDSD